MKKTTTIRAQQHATHRPARQNHFIQWEVATIAPFRQLMVQDRVAALVLTSLWERLIPGSGGIVVISRTTLAEIIGKSLSTVERALRVLIRDGWVQRMRIGSAYALAINHRVVWIGPREQMQHAVFQATVIASRSEQDEIALNPPQVMTIPFDLVTEEEPRGLAHTDEQTQPTENDNP